MDKITGEILKRLDLIGAKLGVASQQIWAFAVKQQVIMGWISLAFNVFGLLLGVALMLFGYKDFIKVCVKEEPDGDILKVFFCIVGIVITIVAFLVFFVNCTEYISIILNPEYMAFKNIVQLMKPY